MSKFYFYYHVTITILFVVAGYILPFTIGDNWRERIFYGVVFGLAGTLCFLILPILSAALSAVVRFGIIALPFVSSDSMYQDNEILLWLGSLFGVFNIYSAVVGSRHGSNILLFW